MAVIASVSRPTILGQERNEIISRRISKIKCVKNVRTKPRVVSISARKFTRRSTDQINRNPQDPFEPRETWRPGGDDGSDRRRSRQKEPFDAELLVLFGLPAVIILIPWVFKDPTALAVVPLALIIPGPRDIILSVMRDFFTGYKRAKQFVRPKNSRQNYNRWDDEYSANGGRRYPPPPPPPRAGGGPMVYDLDEEEFAVVEDLSPSDFFRDGDGQNDENFQTSDDNYNSSSTPTYQEQQKGQQYWDSDTTDDEADYRSPRQTDMYGGDGNAAPRKQPSSSSVSTSRRPSNSEAETTSPSYRRSGSRIRPASGQAGRDLVRKSGGGRQVVGIDIRQDGRRRRGNGRDVPWYMRPLVVLFPFLRYWGGFM